MSARDEDEAWKAIVDNYGDRPVLDGATAAAPEPDQAPATDFPVVEEAEQTEQTEPEEAPDPEERFVPPPPPPLPRTTRLRSAAWAGVLGAPTLLVLMALLDVTAAPLFLLGLTAAFVGGFVYLVATMGQEPRDPWDNGARV